MKSRRGYTLLELVIACSLVTLVLAAMYSMVSSVVNFQTEAVRKSSVSAWNAVSMNMMTKEVEDATVIYYPDPNSTQSNSILGCSNWSTIQQNSTTGGSMDASTNTTYFYYCLDTTTGPSAPSGAKIPVLRRIAASGPNVSCPARGAYSPTSGPVPCTNTAPTLSGAALYNSNDIVASAVNLPPSGYMFTYAGNAAANSMNVAFVIGNESAETPGTATANAPTNAHIVNPQTSTVNISIAVNRSYLDSKD